MLKKIIIFILIITLFLGLNSEVSARQKSLEQRTLEAFNLSQDISYFQMQEMLSLVGNRKFIELRIEQYEFGKNWDKNIPVPEIRAEQVIAGAMIDTATVIPTIGITKALIGLLDMRGKEKRKIIRRYILAREEAKGNTEENAWNDFRNGLSRLIPLTRPNPMSPLFIDSKIIDLKEFVNNPESDYSQAARLYFAFVWESTEMAKQRGDWNKVRNWILSESQKFAKYPPEKTPSVWERTEDWVGDVLISAGEAVWRGGRSAWSFVREHNPFGAGTIIPEPLVPAPAEPEIIEKALKTSEEKSAEDGPRQAEVGQEIEPVESVEPVVELETKPELARRQKLIEIKEILDSMVKEVDALSKQVDELVVQKLAREKQEEGEKTEDGEKAEDEEIDEETKEETEEQESNTFLANILISEVVTGLNEAKNEFIELYNPNDFDVILTNDNFKLKLVNSNNRVTNKRITELPKTIPAHSYFLLVGGEIEGVIADAFFSSQLTRVSGVIITDGDDNIKDRVGWGKICAPEIEDCERKLPPSEAVEEQGTALGGGLKTGQSLGRRWATTTDGYIYIDSDDNVKDFEIQFPTPGAKNQTLLDEDEDKEIEDEQEEDKEETIKQTGQKEIVFCDINIVDTPARNRVIFNEIAWMGSLPKSGETTRQAANNEWIELKNISGSEINLDGWQVLDKDNQIKIVLGQEDRRGLINKTITHAGFYILERSDDNSVPNILADFVYTGGLRNNNEALYLFDNNCQLQDKVSAEPDWPINDNEKRTMERTQDLSWQMSLNSGGTPKSENSRGYVRHRRGGGSGRVTTPPVIDPIIDPDSNPDPEPMLGIIINEIQLEGQTKKDEFIELFNNTTSTIDLSGFALKKKTSGGNESNLVSSGKFVGKILAKNYFLIVPQLKYETSYYQKQNISTISYSGKTFLIAQNNTILLYDSNDNLIDKIGFGNAQDYEFATTSNPVVGESIGRRWSTTTENYIDSNDNSQDFEIQTPTPGARNQILLYKSAEDGQDQSEDQLAVNPAEQMPTLAVVINEIAWMGTEAEATDEWIELYNNTTSTIDLAGWVLEAKDGTPKIELFGEISAKDYFLLERKHNKEKPDDTISDIPANQIYTGALENDGEVLELRDANNNLIDKVGCIKNENQECKNWFAGNRENRISMERIDPKLPGTDLNNWANNRKYIASQGLDANDNPILGTPKAINSAFLALDKIIWVDGSLGTDEPENRRWNTIQKAVDNAQQGDIILIGPGIYSEDIIIKTSNLTIRPKNENHSVKIVPAKTRTILKISADNVEIKGLFFSAHRWTRPAMTGIYINNANNSLIKENKFEYIHISIHLTGSENNTIIKNNIRAPSHKTRTLNTYSIRLDYSNENTIQENIITRNRDGGIYLWNSNNNVLKMNILNENHAGITLDKSSNNNLKKNVLNGNHNSGMSLHEYSNNNSLTENNIKNSSFGIFLTRSKDNILRKNSMYDSKFYLGKDGFNNDVGNTNLINGKIIYHIRNKTDFILNGEDTQTDQSPAMVFCVNCENVTIKNLSFDTSFGIATIHLYRTNNSFIKNLDISNNNDISKSKKAILLEYSNNIFIYNNRLYNNAINIWLDHSNNNTLSENIINQNATSVLSFAGIFLRNSSNNKISNNLILYNGRGIMMRGISNDNIFFQNTVKQNGKGIMVGGGDISNNNIFFQNTVKQNGKGIMVEVWGRFNHNLFYHNNFIDNRYHYNDYSVRNRGSENQWFCSPVSVKAGHCAYENQGNHYSFYNEPDEGCNDLDNNKICDDPYILNFNNKDAFPFINENGWENL